jgi:hypothetical protein
MTTRLADLGHRMTNRESSAKEIGMRTGRGSFGHYSLPAEPSPAELSQSDPSQTEQSQIELSRIERCPAFLDYTFNLHVDQI